MGMNKEQLRAWVTSVLSEGITPLQWARASGFKNDNQLRNFLSRPKAGMNADTVAKLQAGLAKLHGVPPAACPEPPAPMAGKSPRVMANDLKSAIMTLCDRLDPEAHVYVDVDGIADEMKAILGHVQEAPKRAQKKI